ncbi:MAG TPA: hypothetical protein VH986_13205 [Acidimicrobiia bacterium]|jgi:hypothetical protein
MSELVGTPSDDVPEVLSVGRCVVTHLFVSMSARDPDGRDVDYLRWHTFDHRPEQSRIDSIRGSLRLVSTPECRAARVVNDERYDAVDHVMTYFFADIHGLTPFNDLAIALGGAGRIPWLLPMVERGVYRLDGVAAAPRIKVGADVLPWSPLLGGYVVVERGAASPAHLVDVGGVAGVWWGGSEQVDPTEPTADGHPWSGADGLQITYCFLDEDPVTVADRMSPTLEQRWARGGVVPLLAAPFHAVAGFDYDHHLP